MSHNRKEIEEYTNNNGLVIIKEIEKRPVGLKMTMKRFVLVKCHCSNEFQIALEQFEKKKYCMSCKGLLLGDRTRTHGQSRTKEYKSALAKTEKRKQSLKNYRESEKGKLMRRTFDHNRRVLIGPKLKKSDIQFVIDKSNSECFHCHIKIDFSKRFDWHLDHYIPVSKGGLNIVDNLVVSCPTCNRKKSNKLPLEFCND